MYDLRNFLKLLVFLLITLTAYSCSKDCDCITCFDQQGNPAGDFCDEDKDDWWPQALECECI